MRQSRRLLALVSALALVTSLAAGCGGSDDSGGGNGFPARQNRRSALIDAALAPARDDIDPAAAQHL